MKLIFTYILIALKVTGVFSQDLKVNYYKLKDFKPNPNYLKTLFLGYDSIYKSITFVEKKENKVVKEALKETKTNLESFEKDDVLMKKDSITQYLQNLVNYIQQKNILIKGRKTIFTYRTTIPNAANYGNGIILFNLDLLAKLNKEEYVAFILCHEIGHDIKGHVIEGIRQNYEIQTSADLQKQFETVKKQEYNRYKSYEVYAAEYLSRLTSKNRKLEVQADSIGLFLYYNAGYDLNDAYKTIQSLDSVDNETYTTKINFLKFFDFPEQPFKKSWLVPEEEDETIDGGNLAKRPDSLKTHPDCKIRLKLLKEIKLKDRKSTPANPAYARLNVMSQFEMLEVYKDEKEYSEGLYNALQLSGLYPNNLYLKCSILDFLLEIHNSKEKHFFSGVTDKPDKKNAESYNELLYFLGNVNSSSLLNIINGYFKANFNTNINDAYAGYVFSLLKGMGKTKEQQFVIANEYEKSFGKNDYLIKLKNKYIPKK